MKILIWGGLLVAAVAGLLVTLGQTDEPGPLLVDSGVAANEGALPAGESAPRLGGSRERAGDLQDREGSGVASLSGLVVLPDGTPLAGRRVRALLQTAASTGLLQVQQLQVRLSAIEKRPRSTAVTRTDGQGRFLLRGLDPAAAYMVSVETGPMECASSHWLDGGRTEFSASARLVVGEGVPLELRVQDAEGRGLRAHVALHVAGDSTDHPKHLRSWSVLSAETDAHGVIRFPSVPKGSLHANVHMAWHTSLTCMAFDVPADGEVTLRVGVARGAEIFGQVTSSAGSAVADAQVIATIKPADGWAALATRATATDAAGTYRLVALPDGVLESLTVLAGGRLQAAAEHSGTALSAEKATRADVAFEPTRRIVGRVLTEAGKPVPGVAVRALKSGPLGVVLVASATSGPSGAFVLRDVGSGQRWLQAAGAGWHQRLPPGRIRDYEVQSVGGGWPVVCGPEATEFQTDLIVRRGLVLKGRTVDASGRAVSGATILVSGRRLATVGGWDLPGLLGQPVSEVDGTFEVFHFARESRGRVQAVHGRQRSASFEVGPSSSANPITLVLSEAHSVGGHVLDSQGSPLQGMELEFEDLGLRAVTNAEGAFRFHAVPRGTHQISLRPAEYGARYESKHAQVTVEDRAPGGLTLQWDAVGQVRGVVVDGQGKPLDGARILLFPVDAGYEHGVETWTREDGSFVLRWLSQGTHGVRIDDQVLDETVDPGEEDVRLVLHRAAVTTLTGRVVDAQGMPLSGGWVRAHDSLASSSASLDLGAIQAGRFTLRLVDAPEQIRLRVDEVVRANGRRDLRPVTELTGVDPRGPPLVIRVADGLDLSGRVVDGGGAAVSGVRLDLKSAEDGDRVGYGRDVLASVNTTADGTFRFIGLGPGQVIFDVPPSAEYAGTWGVTATAGNTKLTVRLETGRVARLLVRSHSGKPVEGAAVYVFDPEEILPEPDDARHSGRTDARGKLVLRGLRPGQATLYVGPLEGAEATWPYPALLLEDVDVATLETITLPRGYRFEVELVGPAGKPVAEREVKLSPEGSLPLMRTQLAIVAGTPGLYRAPALAKGAYRLEVTGRGAYLKVEDVPMQVPGPRARVRLRSASALRGRILGAQPSMFRLGFYGQAAGTAVSKWDYSSDGAFEVILDPAARGVLYGSSEDSDLYVLLQDVAAPRHDIVLRLQTGLRIVGRIEGWPQGKEGLLEGRHAFGLPLEADVAADGTFAIRGVPPGRVRLSAWWPDFQREATAEVDAGATGVVVRAK